MIKPSPARQPATAGRPKCCATSSATDNLAGMLASDSLCSARPLGVMSTSTERTSAGSGGPLHQPQPFQPTNRAGDGGGASQLAFITRQGDPATPEGIAPGPICHGDANGERLHRVLPGCLAARASAGERGSAICIRAGCLPARPGSPPTPTWPAMGGGSWFGRCRRCGFGRWSQPSWRAGSVHREMAFRVGRCRR
jgi:hypothetical protein